MVSLYLAAAMVVAQLSAAVPAAAQGNAAAPASDTTSQPADAVPAATAPANAPGNDKSTSVTSEATASADKAAAEKLAPAAPENKFSTVSLSGMISLQEVCAEIEKQTGNKVIDYRDRLQQKASNPRFKLEIKNAPFWQAVDALLDSTQMTVYHYSGKDGLAIIERPQDELPRRVRAIYVGPLRLEVTRLIEDRQPGLKKPGSLKINLAVAWEPRLAPVKLVQRLNQLQAVDDQGHVMRFEEDEATLEAPIEGGGTGVELLLPFEPPPREVKTIASLKGTLNLSLPGKIATFEFDKLDYLAQARAKPVEKTQDDATVIVDQVRKNNDLWEVLTRVRFSADGNNSADTSDNWILQNEAYLKGPEQKRVENAGFHTTARTNNELGITYQFELPAGVEDYTFVYKTPSSIHTLPVEYEIKNLQLP
jgi:hypothetical protein